MITIQKKEERWKLKDNRNNSWRTVLIEEPFEASLRDNQMVLQNKEKTVTIPIYQIREIICESGYGSLSLPLIQCLIENHVAMCICNHKKIPIGKICGMSENYETAGRIMDQAEWANRKKAAVWKQIVQLKITTEIELLKKTGRVIPIALYACKEDTLSNDKSNREAVASKLYFNALFGHKFVRFTDDDINSALNYGYTILCNSFCRIITIHGYCTELGIHHCNRQNKYNLACDFMEPFRVFVDEIVFNNGRRHVDIEYKKQLIGILHTQCIYDNKTMRLYDAMEEFSLDVISAMNSPRSKLKRVGMMNA